MSLEQIITSITFPNFVENTFLVDSIGDIEKDLSMETTIQYPIEGFKFLNFLSPEEQSQINIDSPGDYSINYDDVSLEDVSSGKIETCTYYCSSEHFRIHPQYMNYLLKNKKYKKFDLMVKVYGFNRKNYAHGACGLLTSFLSNQEFPKLPIPNIPEHHEEKTYLTFEEETYHASVENNEEFCVLQKNLDYDFYSRIPISDTTFTYDIDRSSFYIEQEPVKNIDDYVKKHYPCISEIKNFSGIFFIIHQAKLIPFGNYGTELWIAKYMKLPKIPATVLYVGNRTDIPKFNEDDISISKEEINSIFDPYFKFI